MDFDGIHRDLVKPSRKFRFASKLVGMTHDLHEYVLRNIVGSRVAQNHAVSQIPYDRQVTRNQLVEIAGLSRRLILGEKLLVAGGQFGGSPSQTA